MNRIFQINFSDSPVMQVTFAGDASNGEGLSFSITRDEFNRGCEKLGLPKLDNISPNVTHIQVRESFYFPSQVFYKDGTTAPLKALGIPLSTFTAYMNNIEKFAQIKYANLDINYFPFKDKPSSKAQLSSANDDSQCCLPKNRCTIL